MFPIDIGSKLQEEKMQQRNQTCIKKGSMKNT